MKLSKLKVGQSLVVASDLVLKGLDYEGGKKIVILQDSSGKEIRLSKKDSAEWLRNEKNKVKEEKYAREAARPVKSALDKGDMAAIKESVADSYTKEEMDKFKDFADFFGTVDVDQAYEEGWNAKKYKPYYKEVYEAYKAGKFKVNH